MKWPSEWTCLETHDYWHKTVMHASFAQRIKGHIHTITSCLFMSFCPGEIIVSGDTSGTIHACRWQPSGSKPTRLRTEIQLTRVHTASISW